MSHNQKIKHVSFDVWNTLLIPNPAFAAARTHHLQQAFSLAGKHYSFDEVKNRYMHTKRYLDNRARTHGEAVSVIDAYRELIGSDELTAYKIQTWFIDPITALFNMYPPTMLDSTKSLIRELKHRGISMSIASNTNFISGVTLYPLIKYELESTELFDFALFSDTFGVSKPHEDMFRAVIKTAMRINRTICDEREILHVGDDVVCDVEGPHRYFNIKTALCGTPQDLYNTVIKTIESNQ